MGRYAFCYVGNFNAFRRSLVTVTTVRGKTSSRLWGPASLQ